MTLAAPPLHFSNVSKLHTIDGLWRPMSGIARTEVAGRRMRPRLVVPPMLIANSLIEYSGEEQLGGEDQSCFLAICAQACHRSVELPCGSTDPTLSRALDSLGIGGGWAMTSGVLLRTSLTRIAKDAGYAVPDKQQRSIRDSLDRLSRVNVKETVFVDTREHVATSGLLKYYLDAETAETCIQINPRQALVILGKSTAYVQVSLTERAKLNSEIAKLIHFWLCCYVRLGCTLANKNGTSVDNLMRHLWPEIDALPPHFAAKSQSDQQKILRDGQKTRSKKRELIRAALLEISLLWVLDLRSDDRVFVRRPKSLPLLERLRAIDAKSCNTMM